MFFDFVDYYEFGKYLYLDKDYKRAIGEFNKALYLNYLAGLNKSDSLNYLIGMSYSKIPDYGLANSYLFMVTTNSPVLYENAAIQAGKNLILGGAVDSAVTFVRNVYREIFSDENSRKLSLLLASGYLLLEDYKSSSATLIKADLNDTEFYNYSSELGNFKPKSGLMAGLLSSVVPGAGKCYTGNLDDGLISMFTIGLLGFRTVIEYRRYGVNSLNFLAFGLISMYFYIGNIYGSIMSARQYNQKRVHAVRIKIIDLVDEIK